MAIRKVISIEPGSITTKISRTTFGDPKGKIKKAIEFMTPTGAIDDGQIVDRDSYLYALKRELKAGHFGVGYLCFVINSSRVLQREVTLPYVSKRTRNNLIEAGKEDYFPVDVSEHDLAYTILESDKKKNVTRLMLYAIPRKLIDQYFELAAKLKCKLVAIDFAGNAVNQWIGQSSPTLYNESLNILMQINDQNTVVTIIDNKVPVLQRNVNFGTQQVLDVIKGCYEQDKLSSEEAYEKLQDNELIANSFTFQFGTKPDNMEWGQWNVFCDNKKKITQSLQPLILSLTRMIEFYATKNKTAQVQIIRVIGSGLKLRGLIDLMNNEIGLPVEAMRNCFKKKKKSIRFNNSSDLVGCFGASFSPIQYINRKFEDGEKYWAIALCIVILTGVCAFWGQFLLKDIYAEQKKWENHYQELLADKDAASWVVTETSEIESYLSDQVEVLRLHDETYNNNERLKELLLLLEKEVPSSTIIHSFSSTGETLTMSITVRTKADAEKLLYRLNGMEEFGNVTISGITQNEAQTGITTVSFSLSCKIVNPNQKTEPETKR